jgi:hypothetical protein
MVVVPIRVNLLVQLEVTAAEGSLVRRLALLYLKVCQTGTSRLPSHQQGTMALVVLPIQSPVVATSSVSAPLRLSRVPQLDPQLQLDPLLPLQHLKLLLQQLNQQLRLPLLLLSPTCSMLLGLV